METSVAEFPNEKLRLFNHQAALHFKNDCNYFSPGNLAFNLLSRYTQINVAIFA